MVPSCRLASTLKVTVPGATPSLLHFVPSGRSTTNLQSPFHGWASTVQPVLSAMRAQSGPHDVTTQVDCRPGPFGTKVPLKSSARAGSRNRWRRRRRRRLLLDLLSRSCWLPFAGGVQPLFAGKTAQSASLISKTCGAINGDARLRTCYCKPGHSRGEKLAVTAAATVLEHPRDWRADARCDV